MTARKLVVAGNWKMSLALPEEAAVLVTFLKTPLQEIAKRVDVIVCPPFTLLYYVWRNLKGSGIKLGAQDVFWEPRGAFTGEISVEMLAGVFCEYVIIGHSERRTHFGETDETVRRKLMAVLQHGLTPIVCIGETLAERDAHQTFNVLIRQLDGALKGLAFVDVVRIVLAYEPVWAIGTGRHATPEQAQEAHAFIREWLTERYQADVAESIRIQYGGSVTSANAASLLHQPDVDGALVGGASLTAETFGAIVKAAVDVPTKSAVRSQR